MTNEPGTAWLPAPVIGFSTLSLSCFTHLSCELTLFSVSVRTAASPPPRVFGFFVFGIYEFMDFTTLCFCILASIVVSLWSSQHKQNSCKKQFLICSFLCPLTQTGTFFMTSSTDCNILQ